MEKPLTSAQFIENYPVPPEVPYESFQLSMKMFRSSVYIGGRYCKYDRELPETPCFINGEDIGELIEAGDTIGGFWGKGVCFVTRPTILLCGEVEQAVGRPGQQADHHQGQEHVNKCDAADQAGRNQDQGVAGGDGV